MYLWLFLLALDAILLPFFSAVLFADGLFRLESMADLIYTWHNSYAWSSGLQVTMVNWIHRESSMTHDILYTRLTSVEIYRVCAPDVIKSKIQNKRATKGFILIRHKRYQIYACLQLSSSIASFVWKPAHFEFQSYGGAWHNTKIAFVEKYTLISWYLAILGVKVSGKVLF